MTLPPPAADAAAPDPSTGWPAATGADPGAPERELLARIAAGDRRALEALYRANAGWLTARLARRCADPELVDSALQDTFVAVWRGASGYRGQGDVGAWLWGIAVRRLVDQTRRRKPVPLDPATAATAGRPAFGGGPTADASAESEVLAAHLGGELGDAFHRLEPDLQAVLLVTAVDGLSTREAGLLLGIPQGTVKTRLARARARLQEGWT